MRNGIVGLMWWSGCLEDAGKLLIEFSTARLVGYKSDFRSGDHVREPFVAA